MRLIDADALVKDLVENYIFTGFTELLEDFASAIRSQPTVDAVPIEWIRKYTKVNRLYQSDDFDLYIDDMIADWMERKEE